MQAAIIRADFDRPIRLEDIDPEKDLHRLVGGNFQLVGLSPYSMNMYVIENGRIARPRGNMRATLLCHWAEAYGPGERVVGDAVVLGPSNGRRAVNTGLSETQQEWIRRFDLQSSNARVALMAGPGSYKCW